MKETEVLTQRSRTHYSPNIARIPEQIIPRRSGLGRRKLSPAAGRLACVSALVVWGATKARNPSKTLDHGRRRVRHISRACRWHPEMIYTVSPCEHVAHMFHMYNVRHLRIAFASKGAATMGARIQVTFNQQGGCRRDMIDRPSYTLSNFEYAHVLWPWQSRSQSQYA